MPVPPAHRDAALADARRFPSKIDAWLAVVLAVSAAVLIGAAWSTFADQPAFAALALLPLAFVAWMVVRTEYLVTRDRLLVRSGPLRWTIPLAAVSALHATRNPLSAPALSLDRIAVMHPGGTLVVSPKDKAGFVAAIAAGTGTLVSRDVAPYIVVIRTTAQPVIVNFGDPARTVALYDELRRAWRMSGANGETTPVR